MYLRELKSVLDMPVTKCVLYCLRKCRLLHQLRPLRSPAGEGAWSPALSCLYLPALFCFSRKTIPAAIFPYHPDCGFVAMLSIADNNGYILSYGLRCTSPVYSTKYSTTASARHCIQKEISGEKRLRFVGRSCRSWTRKDWSSHFGWHTPSSISKPQLGHLTMDAGGSNRGGGRGHLPAELATDTNQDLSFTLPSYTCRYPLRLNPLYLNSRDLYTGWIRDWLRSVRVHEALSPKKFEILVNSDAQILTASTHPFAGEWGLRWHLKLTFFAIVFDYVVDEEEMGTDPAKVLPWVVDLQLIMMWSFPDETGLRDNLASIMSETSEISSSFRDEQMTRVDAALAKAKTLARETIYADDLSLVCNVYRDVWADALTKSAPDAMLRLAYNVQEWLRGCVQESNYRRKNTLPESVDAYITLRKKTTATPVFMASADIVNGISCPNDWLRSPPMVRMMDAVTDYFGWQNDIISFKKEVLIQKELFNLVLSLSFYENISYQEAAEVARKMADKRLEDLDEAVDELETITPPELHDTLILFTEAAKGFCSGSVHFMSISKKYK